MKWILSALCALVLCSCAATRQAQADLEQALLDVKTTTEELKEKTLLGASQEELDELDARLQEEIAAAKAAAERVPEAVKEDVEDAKDGLIGLGSSAEGGIAGLLFTGLAWYLRDRRKKKGTDPLQLAGVNTPPTNTGPAG